MRKKIICIFLALSLILTPLIVSTVTAKNNEKKLINKLLDDLEESDIKIDPSKTDIIEKFEEIVDEDEEIKFCGPAYINSSGKGLFLLRNKKVCIIESFISSEIKFSVIWWVFSSYSDENATTEITPLKTGETIKINGKHKLLTGVIVFPFVNQISTIEQILEILLQKDIKIPVYEFFKNIHGRMPWPWTIFGIPLLGIATLIGQFALTYRFIKCLIPVYAMFVPIGMQGYTPYVIWTE